MTIVFSSSRTIYFLLLFNYRLSLPSHSKVLVLFKCLLSFPLIQVPLIFPSHSSATYHLFLSFKCLLSFSLIQVLLIFPSHSSAFYLSLSYKCLLSFPLIPVTVILPSRSSGIQPGPLIMYACH